MNEVKPSKEQRTAHSHPGAQQLARFMSGRSLRDEAREIVRHLLTGCSECKAVTRQLWSLAEQELERPSLLQGKARLEVMR
jgi:hypothetical protein